MPCLHTVFSLFYFFLSLSILLLLLLATTPPLFFFRESEKEMLLAPFFSLFPLCEIYFYCIERTRAHSSAQRRAQRTAAVACPSSSGAGVSWGELLDERR